MCRVGNYEQNARCMEIIGYLERAMTAKCPEGYDEHTDPYGNVYYVDTLTGATHPATKKNFLPSTCWP